MATDTARIKLELASGRNEITAPFHQTAQRKRNKAEPTVVPGESSPAEQVIVAEPPADTDTMIDVPRTELGTAPVSGPTVGAARPRISLTPWIAFIAALLAVAAAVWWVMFQRLPDIDAREVIERNLGAARQAMGEGRYTDPPESSALHYYSTVLALDPSNAQAIAGIDAIADRHLTDARVLLADRRVAEAGVALEKARRVRPNHSGLLALDTLLRVELRKILASSTAVNTTPIANLVRPPAAKPAANSPVARSRAPAASVPVAAKSEPTPGRSAPEVANVLLPLVNTAPLSPALADAKQTLTAEAKNAPVAEPLASSDNPSGSAANVEEAATVTTAASALPERAPPVVQSVEPKLIKMVQPEYPQEALMRGIEGWVDVSLQVTAAGDVVAPRIEESSRGRLFNRSALTAVQQWKYEPRSGDQATTERVRVRLQFRQSR